MMAPNTQLWAAVEEKLATDVAIWKSKVPHTPRPEEFKALVEGTSIKLTGKGVTTIRIGNLDWEVTPPSEYTGYCEKNDDWMVVSASGFKVAIRAPHGSGLLHVCPCGEEVEFIGSKALLPLSMQNLGLREGSQGLDVSMDNLDIDEKLNSLLSRFFNSKGSQKKLAEIIGKKIGAPFVWCVNDLQTSRDISEVLETILGFSAAYNANLIALQQVQEEFDSEDSYFYSEEQVNHAAMRCQAAAAATSEVAKTGARMLFNMCCAHPEDEKLNSTVVENLTDSEMEDELNPNSISRVHCDRGDLKYGSSSNFEEQHLNLENPGFSFGDPGPPSLNCDQIDLDDFDGSNNPTSTLPRSLSFINRWQSGIETDTSSESSWEVVRSQENESQDEFEVVGAEFSDAESLDAMLKDLDPFGKRDCSPLINEFLSLNLKSAASSASDQSGCVEEERKTKVLERLASWSSSNSSSWTDRDLFSSASSVTTKRTPHLETLAEEPACDPEIARLYRSFVFRAAMEGDVLQWCSCKFNKTRCSIELTFQVGSFMEDDIATLSTGILHSSPLRIEIFLGLTNMRESLVEGNVRIFVHQGPSFGSRGHASNIKIESTTAAIIGPVAGLSCYIPHLVRQYLKQEVRERSISGDQFPDGDLLTGLMQYVVAQLVFMRHSCCVCNHQTQSDVLVSMVPRPCGKNLCQALFNVWLVVAPPMILDLSTIVEWLKACFDQDSLYEAFMSYYMSHKTDIGMVCFVDKYKRVGKWLAETQLLGSWLKVSTPKVTIAEKLEEKDVEYQENDQTTTRYTKRRRTWQPNDPDESIRFGGSGNWSSDSSPWWGDGEPRHTDTFLDEEFVESFEVSPAVATTHPSPAITKSCFVLKQKPLMWKSREEKASAASSSACALNPIPPGESSSQGDLEPLFLSERTLFASAGSRNKISHQAQEKSSFQADLVPLSWEDLSD